MHADADANFSSLAHYSLEDKCIWSLCTDALAANLWQNIIAVDGIDLANFGPIYVKRTPHVAALAKHLPTFSGAALVNYDVDLGFWQYRGYSKHPYVADLCPLTEDQLSAWCGCYMVHEDALATCHTNVVILIQKSIPVDLSAVKDKLRAPDFVCIRTVPFVAYTVLLKLDGIGARQSTR